MQLTLKEAATLFREDESVILDWIKARKLPALHVNGRYHFSRENLLEWAALEGIRVSPEALHALAEEEPVLPQLADMIEAGGICYDLAGADKESVLREMVARLPLPPAMDRDMLFAMLLAREALGSTALGEGIAIPHPRSPIVLHVEKPFITLCFLRQPVDFGALDDKPVSILFTLITRSVRLHLHTLSRLGYVLHDPAVREALERRMAADVLLPAIRTAEKAIRPRNPSPAS